MTNKKYLVRGVKYCNWMKNKTLPSDFAFVTDFGITAQTRLGQPYNINGKTYEVAAVNDNTGQSIMIVAQIT